MNNSPDTAGRKAPSHTKRRGFVLGGIAALAVGGVMGARWFNVAAQVGAGDMTAKEAFEAVQAGEITLIDIRRPDEWTATGIGLGAIPLDMRADDFTKRLMAQTAVLRDHPVALICARGVRSARLAAQLQKAGFSRIINVPEGMLGSGAGPGWLKGGLPVQHP